MAGSTDNAVSVRMGDTYEDVVKLIHMQVNRLVGNGVAYNREQALSDANLAFVKAYHNFDPTKAQFNTHVGFRVQMRILSEFRRLHKKPRPVAFSELDRSGQDQIDKKLSVRPKGIDKKNPEWAEALSEDSKTVLELVLDPTRDVMIYIKERGSDRNSTYRSCVKQYLEDIGWTKRRIIKAFDEIAEAIRE